TRVGFDGAVSSTGDASLPPRSRSIPATATPLVKPTANEALPIGCLAIPRAVETAPCPSEPRLPTVLRTVIVDPLLEYGHRTSARSPLWQTVVDAQRTVSGRGGLLGCHPEPDDSLDDHGAVVTHATDPHRQIRIAAGPLLRVGLGDAGDVAGRL